MPLTIKQYVKAVLLGVGVIVGTPLLTGLLSTLYDTPALFGITLMTALSAGIIATALDLGLDKVKALN